jgi:hypothetical protein
MTLQLKLQRELTKTTVAQLHPRNAVVAVTTIVNLSGNEMRMGICNESN